MGSFRRRRQHLQATRWVGSHSLMRTSFLCWIGLFRECTYCRIYEKAMHSSLRFLCAFIESRETSGPTIRCRGQNFRGEYKVTLQGIQRRALQTVMIQQVFFCLPFDKESVAPVACCGEPAKGRTASMSCTAATSFCVRAFAYLARTLCKASSANSSGRSCWRGARRQWIHRCSTRPAVIIAGVDVLLDLWAKVLKSG
jgi:hypothetical protein